MFWKSFSLLALALSLGSVLGQTAPPKPAATERELLQRLATPLYGSGTVKAEVLVGQLPPKLGLSLPPGSRVIGSVTTETPDPSFPAGVTVYLDTALTPAQVDAYFAKTLPGAGWKVFPKEGDAPSGEGGFQSSAVVGGGYYYRQSPDQTLSVSVRRVGQTTQITLSRERSSNLKQILSYVGQSGPSSPSLPRLLPPADANVSPRGGGSNGNNVTQYAELESKLSRSALYDHYAAQLRKTGWTLSNRAETGKLISTLWTFTDDGQQRVGLFLLSEVRTG